MRSESPFADVCCVPWARPASLSARFYVRSVKHCAGSLDRGLRAPSAATRAVTLCLHAGLTAYRW